MSSARLTPEGSLVSSTGPRGFRAFDQLLGRSASTPNQYLASTSPTPLPTPLQQASIVVLQDLDDEFIFACLAKVRTVQDGLESLCQAGLLSSQQIDSILALSGCPIGLVLAWLNSARYNGK